MELIIRSGGFACLLLIIAVVYLVKWGSKAWKATTDITKQYYDAMIKVTVVMEKVLDKFDKEEK